MAARFSRSAPFAALVGLCLASVPSLAQTPTALVAGAANQTFTRAALAWCSVDQGTTTFQRAPGAAPRISFPPITYTEVSGNNKPRYYALSGQATFSFSTATTGFVSFDLAPANAYPLTVRRPSFSNYAQSYDATAKVLNVTFQVRFPLCAVAFGARYRN